MTAADIAIIRETVYKLVNFQYNGTIKVSEGDCLCVRGNSAEAEIVYSEKAELARGFFLLAKELSAGKQEVYLKQKRHFKTLGVMPSLRDDVLTLDSLKQYTAYAAAVGMNTLLLYMEDVYELEDYPYFGYLSGRYTHEELKELDAYADRLGVEVVPCLQSLAHLTTYLKWEEAAPIKETAHSVMVGAEATYKFIEAILKTAKACFHTDKIHLGMDEARELGLGSYLFTHAYRPKSELFAEHVNRVKALCEKYGYTMQIWSDMIFKSCGGYDDEYSKRAVITDDVRDAVQNIGLVYWDYYKDHKSAYTEIIKRHRTISPNVLFAGGIWNWDGYLPNFDYTMKTAVPALEACLDMGIDTVYATVWNDPGDSFLMHSVYDFAIYSEYCYLGQACTDEDIHSVGEFLTGCQRELTSLVSRFFLGYDGATSIGARLIHCDAFYELLRYPIDYEWAAKEYRVGAEALAAYTGTELADYARAAFAAAGEKAAILRLLRPAYQSRDINALRGICDKNYTACIEAISALSDWQELIWHKYQKPFAIEGIQFRFAGLIKRLRYQQQRLAAFLDGKLEAIPELEGEALNREHATWLGWEQVALPRKR